MGKKGKKGEEKDERWQHFGVQSGIDLSYCEGGMGVG